MLYRRFHQLAWDKITGFLFLFITLLLVWHPAFSQKEKKKREKEKRFHPIEIKTLNDTLIPTLVNKVASYTFTLDRDSFLLEHTYKLLPIEERLPDIESQIKNFRSIFNRVGQEMNLQGLNTSTIILKDVKTKLASFLTKLENYKTSLKESTAKVQRIISDSSLTADVSDSVLKDEMSDVISEGKELYSAQNLLLAKINLINSRVSVNQFEANDIISDLVLRTITKKIKIFEPEDSPLFQSNINQYQQSTEEITLKGFEVSWRVILIYLGDRIVILGWAILLAILIFTWCKLSVYHINKREDAGQVFQQTLFLRHHLVAGCLFGLFTYAPLFFADPPAALIYLFGLLQLIMLNVLVYPYITKTFKKEWVALNILWLIYSTDNILLHTSYGERWILLVAGILLMLICLKTIIQGKKVFDRISYSPATKPLALLSFILALLSVIFNLTGNFALAKIAGLSSVQAIMTGVVLKIFSSIIIEAVFLHSEAYHTSRFSEFLNFEKSKAGFEKILWVFASIIWVIVLSRDLTLYSSLSTQFIQFLEIKRPIGKYHFTFASVIIFILIIWISSIISRVVNYFFGYEKSVATGKSSGLNSMVLILRLCIWSAGFLIAVAAAGIPLDKISIMLGALGVGIGFGLQNIVNNLVSGIILAFERPVQVGDKIEVGNKSGTVKEIGVRASKIRNSAGADIIIANGDLLSQQLINWTTQNHQKRIDFTMGLSYETDLSKARELVLNALKKHDDILHAPEPSVIIDKFGQYTIDLKTFFWINDFLNADAIRTNIMIEVKELLFKEGIQLKSKPDSSGASN